MEDNAYLKTRNIISDKLLLEKTGHGLEHWYKVLDAMGARKMDHNAIFELVSTTRDLIVLGQWNQNLLATSYEWSRGLKERGQREKDFEISVSKTVSVPAELLFKAWTDGPLRKKWLGGEKITIRKSTPHKSARITWSDGKTSLSVDFYPKGEEKSQVVVQHQKIPSSGEAQQFREFWSVKLNLLKEKLEAR